MRQGSIGWLVTLALLLGAARAQAAPLEVQLVAGTPENPALLRLAEGPLFSAADNGQELVLRDVYIDVEPSLQLFADFASFADAMVMPNLVNGSWASITLQRVELRTSCTQLQVLQDLACRSVVNSTLVDMEVIPGLLRIPSWHDGTRNYSSLQISCNTSELTGLMAEPLPLDPKVTDAASTGYQLPTQLQLPPAMACTVTHVSNWEQVVKASIMLQQVSRQVHVVLANNISVSGNVSRDTNGTILVYRDYKVWGCISCGLMTTMAVSTLRGQGLWTVYDRKATITFANIIFKALALGPADKYPISVVPWGMWHVAMDRCSTPDTPQLVVMNCALVVTAEFMDYSSHWASELLSAFPDRRRQALWYGIDSTCDPPRNRTLLSQQTELQDQYTWVALTATTLGCSFINTVFTKEYHGVTADSTQSMPLTKLLVDPYAPFPTITWVVKPQQLVEALATQLTPNIVIVANISIPADMWATVAREHGLSLPFQLSRDLVIAGWPGRPTVLDWQGVSGVLDLGCNSLKLRNMVLMNGGQGGPNGSPYWATNLTMYQWPLAYKRADPQLEMQSCWLIVPPSEFAILLGSGSTPSSPTTGRLGGVPWVSTAVIKRPGAAQIALLVDDGMLGYNITLTSTPLAFPLLPMDVVLGPGILPGTRDPPQGVSNSSEGWHIAVAATVPVVVVALTAAIAVIFVVQRARQRACAELGLLTGMPPGKQELPQQARSTSVSDDVESGLTDTAAAGTCEVCGTMASGPAECVHSLRPPTMDNSLKGALYAGPQQGSSQSVAHMLPARLAGGGPDAGLCCALDDGSASVCPACVNQRTLSGQDVCGAGASLSCFRCSSVQHMHQTGGAHSASSLPPHEFGSWVTSSSAGERGNTPAGWPAWAVAEGGSSQPRLTNRVQYSCPMPSACTHQAGSAAPGSVSSGTGAGSLEALSNNSGFNASRQSHAKPVGSNCNSRPRTQVGGLAGSTGTCGQAHDVHSDALSAHNSTAAATDEAVLTGEEDDVYMDSFDRVPADNEQLLINRIEMSRELQESISAPNVAHQLKSMVARLQTELGDQEVTVTRVIGQGGGGVVYQGTWRGLTVAVKTLVFTVLPHQPMSRSQQRAMTEAAICRTLQHPNIVATYAYDLQELALARPLRASQQGSGHTLHSSSSTSSGEQEGKSLRMHAAGPDPPAPIEAVNTATEFKLAIIQEYCDGGTLKAAIDDGKLHETLANGQQRPALASILQIATDIAAGMSHVHSRNVVHGDLTPANVLLRISPTAESRFTAKVADFGLSWKLAMGQEHISNARQGTGFYISPEVLHVGIMSKPADVFSFGMVLHEMYHGTPAWRRRGAGSMATAASAAMQRPGLDQLHWTQSCPQRLRDLVHACLAADPQARPSFFTVVETLLSMQREVRDAAAAENAAGSSAAASVGEDGHKPDIAVPLSTSGVVRAGEVAVLMQQQQVSMSWQPPQHKASVVLPASSPA